MRSMWKGSVSFGLVSIPIKMYLATDQHDVSFRQVRRTDGSRVRYKRVAEADGEEVSYSDIAKGYELPDGSVVILTDDDFADLPLPTKKVIEVLQFVPLSEVDPIYFNKSYYLEPDTAAGLKPYVLLRNALQGTDMVAIVKITISTREQIAALRVRDDVVVLSTMLWPDEIRQPEFDFLGDEVSVRAQEQTMAESLVSSMAGDFEPEQYHDDFADALKQVIDAKLEGGDITRAATSEPQDNVVDIMSALQASIDRAKQRTAGDADSTGDTDAGEEAPAPKKTAAKGAAAKTTTTKKAGAAKKASAKKAAPAKAAAKKAPAEKAASAKTATKKTSARKTSERRSA